MCSASLVPNGTQRSENSSSSFLLGFKKIKKNLLQGKEKISIAHKFSARRPSSPHIIPLKALKQPNLRLKALVRQAVHNVVDLFPRPYRHSEAKDGDVKQGNPSDHKEDAVGEHH